MLKKPKTAIKLEKYSHPIDSTILQQAVNHLACDEKGVPLPDLDERCGLNITLAKLLFQEGQMPHKGQGKTLRPNITKITSYIEQPDGVMSEQGWGNYSPKLP
jgi:hypothetical protein